MAADDVFPLRCRTPRTTRPSGCWAAASTPRTRLRATPRWPGCCGPPPARPARTSWPASRPPWPRSAGVRRRARVRSRLVTVALAGTLAIGTLTIGGCGSPMAPIPRLGYCPPPGGPAAAGRGQARPLVRRGRAGRVGCAGVGWGRDGTGVAGGAAAGWGGCGGGRRWVAGAALDPRAGDRPPRWWWRLPRRWVGQRGPPCHVVQGPDGQTAEAVQGRAVQGRASQGQAGQGQAGQGRGGREGRRGEGR